MDEDSNSSKGWQWIKSRLDLTNPNPYNKIVIGLGAGSRTSRVSILGPIAKPNKVIRFGS